MRTALTVFLAILIAFFHTYKSKGFLISLVYSSHDYDLVDEATEIDKNQCKWKHLAKQVRSGIGNSCNSAYDCNLPYSICRNGKCRCRPGSIKKCGVCEPINYRCPFGQALSNFKGIIKCTINTITFKDDCPKRGVCCGKGNANPRGNCLKGLVLKGYGNCRTYCPKETHFCTVFSTVVQELSPCCPRPCLNNTYYSGGRCISRPADAVLLY
ncbi:hypothetical protein T4E_2504 [Trichinella pseudospiralis]|uniref:EB domain-containing protein n=1 Tax=Trichinella pseudospiralis TaxID=6337 RepID=A0A0V0YMY1_TRIPS|nr:hypothetical protein T4E_2504 [Trichinella pseudospiralis]